MVYLYFKVKLLSNASITLLICLTSLFEQNVNDIVILSQSYLDLLYQNITFFVIGMKIIIKIAYIQVYAPYTFANNSTHRLPQIWLVRICLVLRSYVIGNAYTFDTVDTVDLFNSCSLKNNYELHNAIFWYRWTNDQLAWKRVKKEGQDRGHTCIKSNE